MTNQTPRHFVTCKENGTATHRYWMADDSSIHMGNYATRALAEIEVEKGNARQKSSETMWADYPDRAVGSLI